jgi:transcriptional regulator with XRE-family HTH domain
MTKKIRHSPVVSRGLRTSSQNLQAWRKLRGLTQAQLAERAGISRDTVIRLEGGDGSVSFENVLSVIRALGVLDGVLASLDPFETDLGRARSEERLPLRVRPRDLTQGDG